MVMSKVGVGLFLSALGVVFLLKNKTLGKAASKFYQKFYTEERTIIMFKISGLLLLIGGLIIGFVG